MAFSIHSEKTRTLALEAEFSLAQWSKLVVAGTLLLGAAKCTLNHAANTDNERALSVGQALEQIDRRERHSVDLSFLKNEL